MRLAVALGGTDLGRSGLGVYVQATLPRLAKRLQGEGGGLVALVEEGHWDPYRRPGGRRRPAAWTCSARKFRTILASRAGSVRAVGNARP